NEIATVCLDETLRIKWFTPATLRLFNLLPTDIGRPIADLNPTARDAALLEDARAVLQSGKPRSQELELQGIHLRRVVPYRDESERLVGVVITFADITEAKRTAQRELDAKAVANRELEQRVRERTEELSRLSRELALAEVRERQVIARDLHDGLGQELNAAVIKLDVLRAAKGGHPANPALDDLAKMLERVVRDMRSLTSQLSPPVLEQLGLVPALEWLAEKMQKNYQLKVHIDDDRVPKHLDGVSASILYRAVRELLINVARHAQVDAARVTARGSDGQVTLQIVDHGTGFDPGGEPPRAPMGLGLAALRERITFLGGRFTLDTERGRGTVATIEVPLHRP
ncbi:MAG TPA: PAS domain-containing protein, partial [Steroidobacteraceae bacterium]|nr:PAS domain-containing protein [Steroidobacteraceae bacterium]